MRTIRANEVKNYTSQGFVLKTGQEKGADGSLRKYAYLTKRHPLGKRIQNFALALIKTIFSAGFALKKPEILELWNNAFHKRTIIRIEPESMDWHSQIDPFVENLESKAGTKTDPIRSDKSAKEWPKEPKPQVVSGYIQPQKSNRVVKEVLPLADLALFQVLENPPKGKILPEELANRGLDFAIKNKLDIGNPNLLAPLKNADTLEFTLEEINEKTLTVLFNKLPNISTIKIYISTRLNAFGDIEYGQKELASLLSIILENGQSLKNIELKNNPLQKSLLLFRLVNSFREKLYYLLSLEDKFTLIKFLSPIWKNCTSCQIVSKSLSDQELSEFVAFVVFSSEVLIKEDRYAGIYNVIELSTKKLKREERQKKYKIILEIVSKDENFFDIISFIELYKPSRRHIAEFLYLAKQYLSPDQRTKLEPKTVYPAGQPPKLLDLALPKAIQNDPPSGVVLPLELANPVLEYAVLTLNLDEKRLGLLKMADKLILPKEVNWSADDLRNILKDCPAISHIQLAWGKPKSWKALCKRLRVLLENETWPSGFALNLNSYDDLFYSLSGYLSPQEVHKLFHLFDADTKLRFIESFLTRNDDRVSGHFPKEQGWYDQKAPFINCFSLEELKDFYALVIENEKKFYNLGEDPDKQLSENIMKSTCQLVELSTISIDSISERQKKYDTILEVLFKVPGWLNIISSQHKLVPYINEFMHTVIQSLSEEMLKELIHKIGENYLSDEGIIRYMVYAESPDQSLEETFRGYSKFLEGRDQEVVFSEMLKLPDYFGVQQVKVRLYMLMRNFNEYGKLILLYKPSFHVQHKQLLLRFAEICQPEHLETIAKSIHLFKAQKNISMKEDFLEAIQSHQPHLLEQARLALSSQG